MILGYTERGVVNRNRDFTSSRGSDETDSALVCAFSPVNILKKNVGKLMKIEWRMTKFTCKLEKKLCYESLEMLYLFNVSRRVRN